MKEHWFHDLFSDPEATARALNPHLARTHTTDLNAPPAPQHHPDTNALQHLLDTNVANIPPPQHYLTSGDTLPLSLPLGTLPNTRDLPLLHARPVNIHDTPPLLPPLLRLVANINTNTSTEHSCVGGLKEYYETTMEKHSIG